jgi:hypothetical protein
MAEVTPPLFLNVDGVYGADELGLPYRDLIGEGVLGYGDLRVSQRAAGANMTVDVSAGTAWIMGDTTPLAQPQYRCRNDAVVNLAIGAAHATLPRIDMVVAEVLDSTFTGASNLWRLRVVAGTAGVGSTLDNRTGAAALPDTAILLADVLVAAADTAISDAEIRDRRPYALPGVIPGLLTDLDMVSFIPHPGHMQGSAVAAADLSYDLTQSAALMYLPRRIVGATRIRFRYQHAASALGGSFAIGIYDASGRLVVSGSQAFMGANNEVINAALTIAATTLERGAYYVLFGIDTTAGGGCTFRGVATAAAGSANITGFANLFLYSNSGGWTVPTTLLGFTDAISFNTTTALRLGVPLVALSVG